MLLLVSLFLRLYRIESTMTFLEDEGRDLLIVKKMVDSRRPVLIGPQTSTGNMYLGPLYYYFITPALVASGFDPIGPALLIAFTGILTVYFLYNIVGSWFGKPAGFLAATMYAVLPLPVAFTRNSWNPNLAPLISLLILYFADKLLIQKKHNKWYYLILGGLLGVLLQLHYMALLIVPLLILSFILGYVKRWRQGIVGFVLVITGFAISMSPFILFELRHDFVNSRAIIGFASNEKNPDFRYDLPFYLWKGKVSLSSTKLIGGLLGKEAFVRDSRSSTITSAFVIITLLSILVWWKKSKEENSKRLLFLYFILFGSMAILGLYQENVHLHYFGFLFPLVFILLASIAANPMKLVRVIGITSIIAILIYSVPTTSGYVKSGPTNQVKRAQEVAAYIAQKSEGRPYNVLNSDTSSLTPFLYFLHQSSNPPVMEEQNTLFMICQDNPCDDSVIHPKMFRKGPAHPSLTEYTGHPFHDYFDRPVEMRSNEHVSHGIWVAELEIKSQ